MFTGEAWFDPIEAGIRGRVRGFIEELLEQELTAALGRNRHERAAEAPNGYRNGSRERQLLGSFGPVQISVPRARMAGGGGGTQEWRSAALPRYARMTRQVEALIASAYLAGTNTRRVKRALTALFAGAIGKDVVSRTWSFGYVIRFRGNIHVTDTDGITKPAAEWVGKGGRARKLLDARVTAKGQKVGAVVCVHAKDMKEPWCLATSERDATAATLVNHYSKRWTIEPQFRDTKDLRFGMGLSSTRIGEPQRRDRLLLISAFATALLTLLGSVGESLGMDRLLKSNTSTTRTHSLFRQGCMLYELIPNMPEHRLLPLIQKFAEAVSGTGLFLHAATVAK